MCPNRGFYLLYVCLLAAQSTSWNKLGESPMESTEPFFPIRLALLKVCFHLPIYGHTRSLVNPLRGLNFSLVLSVPEHQFQELDVKHFFGL